MAIKPVSDPKAPAVLKFTTAEMQGMVEFFNVENLSQILEAATTQIASVQRDFGDRSAPVVAAIRQNFTMAEETLFSVAEMAMKGEFGKDGEEESRSYLAMLGIAHQFNVLLLCGIDVRKVTSLELGEMTEVVGPALNAILEVRKRILKQGEAAVAADGDLSDDLWAD
jgi:hypothetical protein